ncbi:4-hydroxybenzoate polyprenyltransferase [Jiangella aurantiaca]|uniref:4-hydroxybenzoate polyprenyltransferase n=1 Tax=Jiangella aurantiaca TaxID=2530373 RepID=A0A4R5ACS6_9ACTN|nr:UbiA family prenyltransferase [Jiangella aurantiaca]TDD70061.1 4-hydroxybenzoate polyprenyltransferase [Jiangella aurantiaca]
MRFRDVAELVRAPAALTVPGDSLAGAAAAGFPYGVRTAVTPLASACLYWAGMALNDYADRDLDRVERPERPIPSGRVRPGEALALAAGLTAAGVGLAAVAGGRRAVRVAVPLAATVWAYDLVAKATPAGPVAMGAARGLDVLLGAGGRERAAALPALAVATHTVGVTVLSRGEVHGGSTASARAALGATAAASLAAALPPPTRSVRGLAAAGFAALYAATVGRAQLGAARTPDAATVRSATGAGVRGVIPLQSALLARAGAVALAGAVVGIGPAVRALSKVVSPT